MELEAQVVSRASTFAIGAAHRMGPELDPGSGTPGEREGPGVFDQLQTDRL
ncbi:MAG: hypothetical protein KIS83_13615 [Rubrivivax sp.]|nr:hypothetical protein [Rubrivivax sp.]